MAFIAAIACGEGPKAFSLLLSRYICGQANIFFSTSSGLLGI